MTRSTKPTRSSSTHVETNGTLGLLDPRRDRVILRVARNLIDGKLGEHFPPVAWKTGSGTQTNMNHNGAIANRANELPGGELGSKKPAHRNDHVDISPSSNDSFPIAMHVATAPRIAHDLVPALSKLHRALRAKKKAFAKIVKLGRACTHNATPLTLGQEFSDDAAQIERGTKRLELAVTELIPPKKQPGRSIMSMLVYGMMHSIQQLAASVRSHAEHCVNGTLRELMDRSLVMVTALAPKIGCDNATKMAKSNHVRRTMLKETAVPHGFLSRAYFDRKVRPAKMKHAG
jgi:fumarate hydratase class II